MAFTKSDGTPGSYGPNGTAADQRTIGVIAAQGFTEAENAAELQKVIDSNRFILPTSPTYIDPRSIPGGGNSSVEGIGSVKSHADDGDNNVYNTPSSYSTIYGLSEASTSYSESPWPLSWKPESKPFNRALPQPKAGSNSTNSVDESSKKVRSTNYKALTRQGKWNPTKGDFVSPLYSGVSGVYSGVMDNNYSQAPSLGAGNYLDVASAMGISDQASYNPLAPMLVSEGSQPTMFVASYAPSQLRCPCKYPPLYPNAGSPQRERIGSNPGGGREPYCTGGSPAYIWKAKRRIACPTVKTVPLALYIGWAARYQSTEGSGLCYIYGPQSWSYSSRAIDCYNPPAGNTTYACGTWLYNSTAIDQTGKILTEAGIDGGRMMQREFHHIDTVALKCPDFTEEVYSAACKAVWDAGVPDFTICVE